MAHRHTKSAGRSKPQQERSSSDRLLSKQHQVLEEIDKYRVVITKHYPSPPTASTDTPADIQATREAEEKWAACLSPWLLKLDKACAKAVRLGLQDHPAVRGWIETARRFGDREALRRAKCGLEKGVKAPNLKGVDLDLLILKGGDSLEQIQKVLGAAGIKRSREAIRKRIKKLMGKYRKPVTFHILSPTRQMSHKELMAHIAEAVRLQLPTHKATDL